MLALPSVMTLLTFGSEILVSSSQMEIVPPEAFCFSVALANASRPLSFSLSCTTYSPVDALSLVRT